MNLIQLRYFTAVADRKKLTRTAESLRISQPALTRQMRLLEEELGTPLFLRHHRGVQLTEAGVLLRDRTEVILRLVEEVQTELSDRGRNPSGMIRIGFPPSIGGLFLASMTKELRARLPRVTVYLVEGVNHLLPEWLVGRRGHFPLIKGPEKKTF